MSVRHAGLYLRLTFVAAVLVIAFFVWLGRFGVAIGAGGLVSVVLIAWARGSHEKGKVLAAMREADAETPPSRREPYR